MAVALSVDVAAGPDRSAPQGGPGRLVRDDPRPSRAVRRDHRPTSVIARIALAIGGLLLALTGTRAAAIGLGPATLASRLGEPLRITVPVTVQPDEEIGCIQVRPRGDDLPSVFNTRSQVVRVDGQARIEIRSAQSVDEPAIGLVVSVGCTSPIARDYVLFLDPPAVAPTVPSVDGTTAAVPLRRLWPMPTPVRRVRTPPAKRVEPVAGPTTPRATRPSRGAARRPAPAPPPLVVPNAVPNAITVTPPAAPRASAPVAAAPAAPRDRLSVVPTEPAPTTGAAASNGASPPTTVTPSASSPSPPAATPPTPLVAADPDAAAREEAMRRQQVELQAQLKALGDQIAALRVQATTLAARNQALEDTATTSSLVWLLLALAAIALAIAAWMAWRYVKLKRSVEGSAWWTGNTVQAPETTFDETAGDGDSLAALDGGTRMATRAPPRPEPNRGPAAAASLVGSDVERTRSVARPGGYPAVIDTDFTVSDIEAAMAAVRTVSPPRPAAPQPLGETDFAALAGPTLPSPYAEPPPPAAPLAHPPLSSGNARASQMPNVSKVSDLGASFIDVDATPPAPLRARPAQPSPMPGATSSISGEGSTRAPLEATESLDFKLDIPEAFDPLASDSLKTTVVDGLASQSDPIDFELPSAPTPLDFELPSTTNIGPLTSAASRDEPDAPRHGAAALADLFASGLGNTGGPGPDTILALDEQDGSPLTRTEVDRLTATVFDPKDSVVERSVSTRLARFAEVMDRVDESSTSDPLRAIALLRQYVLRDEHIPTLLWLRLFELYRQVDKRPVYEALAEHFLRRYHRPMIGWNETLADRTPQAPLSKMAQIDRQIEMEWGSDAGLERLDTLLCGREQDDAIVFNAVLQRDLLDAAKIYPGVAGSGNLGESLV